jgi:hypothetical protein
MQPAITLSLRLSRQIWVTRTARGLRLHLFYRRSMGALVALVIGGEIIAY